MTSSCYEASRKSWKPGWNTRQANLFSEKHDCNTRTPGKIQVVSNTRRASSIKHQRVDYLPKSFEFSANVVGFETGFLCISLSDSCKALSFESPTSRVISRNPMVGDPSEAKHVYVGTSRKGKNAGEGLFAKRDIKVSSLSLQIAD